MFTPDQDRAAAEMVRVCKRGGKIGLANWTPEGFIGQLFKTIGKHLPPPAGAKSPALWGTRARIGELFEPHASSIKSGAAQFRVPLPLARSIGWRSSRPTTARCSRRSPRSQPAASRPWRATSERSSASSTAPATTPWSCRASIWKSSSRGAEARPLTGGSLCNAGSSLRPLDRPARVESFVRLPGSAMTCEYALAGTCRGRQEEVRA